jgi:hypothetical protein
MKRSLGPTAIRGRRDPSAIYRVATDIGGLMLLFCACFRVSLRWLPMRRTRPTPRVGLHGEFVPPLFLEEGTPLSLWDLS